MRTAAVIAMGTTAVVGYAVICVPVCSTADHAFGDTGDDEVWEAVIGKVSPRDTDV